MVSIYFRTPVFSPEPGPSGSTPQQDVQNQFRTPQSRSLTNGAYEDSSDDGSWGGYEVFGSDPETCPSSPGVRPFSPELDGSDVGPADGERDEAEEESEETGTEEGEEESDGDLSAEEEGDEYDGALPQREEEDIESVQLNLERSSICEGLAQSTRIVDVISMFQQMEALGRHGLHCTGGRYVIDPTKNVCNSGVSTA